MARHPITGHADRHYRRKISAAWVGGIGGVQRPYNGEPGAEAVNMARIAELEQTVKHLQGAIRGVIENRRQGL